MKHNMFSFLSVVLVIIQVAGATGVSDCIVMCNEEREAALSACSSLPAEEQQACREAALDAYDACIETCLASSDAPFIRGDANRDSGVDLADVVFIFSTRFSLWSLKGSIPPWRNWTVQPLQHASTVFWADWGARGNFRRNWRFSGFLLRPCSIFWCIPVTFPAPVPVSDTGQFCVIEYAQSGKDQQ